MYPNVGLSPVHDHKPTYLKIWGKKKKKPPLIVTTALEHNLHIVTNVKKIYEKRKEKKKKRRKQSDPIPACLSRLLSNSCSRR
jgi:hypothetical protein